jgi:hypothetical protein
MRIRFVFVLLLCLFTIRADAQVFGTVRVIARDQQALAVPSAAVTITTIGRSRNFGTAA